MASSTPQARITDRSVNDHGVLTFTLSGVDVAYANAIRRTILSDIPHAVFKTTPYDQNKCTIHTNSKTNGTAELTNEIIKLQLSCIPICVQTVDMSVLEHYELEVSVENTTDTLMWVTTKDFKVKDTKTGVYLADETVHAMFPPFITPTGEADYIQFVQLGAKAGDALPGGKLHLTCKFSVDTAKTDGAYQLASTCSYGCTPDTAKIEEELQKRVQKWTDEGKTKADIDFEKKNWPLLEGQRYIVANSFDFIIETVGVFENELLVTKACEILVGRLQTLRDKVNSSEDGGSGGEDVEISPTAQTTMENAFDIVLPEGYTLGNMLNYELYARYYLGTPQMLTYVGFKKMHPHDTHSLLRIALANSNSGLTEAKQMLLGAIERCIATTRSIYTAMGGGGEKSKK